MILTAIKDLDKHVTRIDSRLGSLEGRFDGLEGMFDGLEVRFDGLERKFDGLEQKVDRIEKTVGGMRPDICELSSRVGIVNRDQIVINDVVRRIQLDLLTINEKLHKLTVNREQQNSST